MKKNKVKRRVMPKELDKTRIDWADCTWNPVWGCLNSCPYCYARNIAKRFGKQVCGRDDFQPVFVEKNFEKRFPATPSRIFVNSMSDIAFWEPEWMDRVFEKIKDYPEHNFLFLTKLSEVYWMNEFPENCCLGGTATSDDEVEYSDDCFRHVHDKNITFLSIEPLLAPIDIAKISFVDWVIIGAETGNRKDRVIPERNWIEDLVQECRINEVPVFLKDNLRPVWGEGLIQKFPEVRR